MVVNEVRVRTSKLVLELDLSAMHSKEHRKTTTTANKASGCRISIFKGRYRLGGWKELETTVKSGYCESNGREAV